MRDKLLSLLSIFLLIILSKSCICTSGGNWGINVHLPTDEKLLNRLAELGPEIVRVDFNWFMLEPEKGVFNWEPFDNFVEFCELHKIKILAVVAYPPEWASGRQGTIHMPENTADWENFITEVVTRYKGKLHSIEIWNEPNFYEFFSGTLEEYFNQLLVPASEIIRSIDSSIQIVAPSITVMENRKWNVWLHRAEDYKECFDIASFHIYRGSDLGVTVKVENVKVLKRMRIGPNQTVEQVLHKKFKGKKIWITETGFKKNNSKQSEIAQSDNIQGVIWGLPSVDRVFIYHLIDGKYDDDNYGILNRDMSRTKAFRYLRSFHCCWEDYAEEEEVGEEK